MKIVVPFAAGATPDIVARLIADDLQSRLNQTFIVENRPGASGNTGTDAVAKAEPDGATIGVSIGGPLAINTLLFGHLPYDPRKDLTLITLLVTQPSVLAINSALGVNSTRELIDVIRRDPGKYAFGSIGAGSLSHLAMEAIALKSGARLVHVPYPSSPQAVTALLRNDVQMVCLPAISIMPQLELGRDQSACRVYCGTFAAIARHTDVAGSRHRGRGRRLEWAYCTGGYSAVDGGADWPSGRRDLRLPVIRDKLAAQLMTPIPGTPAEFRARIDGDIARWSPVIAAAKIKIE